MLHFLRLGDGQNIALHVPPAVRWFVCCCFVVCFVSLLLFFLCFALLLFVVVVCCCLLLLSLTGINLALRDLNLREYHSVLVMQALNVGSF